MHFTLLLTLFAAVSQVVLANGKHRCRNGQLRCNNNLVEQCHSNRYHMVHMCDPGLKCVIQGDGNAEHFTCDPAKRVRSIETEAKAIDVTSRQRHSDVASTGEIEATTTDEPCEPGSRACDKERRFFFKCTEQGSWGEALQCWKPGACQKDRYQELGCTGYPFFDGKNNECDSYCEGYAWLFCLGDGDRDPVRRQKCLTSMCSRPECHACDRCHFKQPDGVSLCPDLSTVVLPPKNAH